MNDCVKIMYRYRIKIKLDRENNKAGKKIIFERGLKKSLVV